MKVLRLDGIVAVSNASFDNLHSHVLNVDLGGIVTLTLDNGIVLQDINLKVVNGFLKLDFDDKKYNLLLDEDRDEINIQCRKKLMDTSNRLLNELDELVIRKAMVNQETIYRVKQMKVSIEN